MFIDVIPVSSFCRPIYRLTLFSAQLTFALVLAICSTMYAVVDNYTDAVKRNRTNDSVGYMTDRRRPWNKCRINYSLLWSGTRSSNTPFTR